MPSYYENTGKERFIQRFISAKGDPQTPPRPLGSFEGTAQNGLEQLATFSARMSTNRAAVAAGFRSDYSIGRTTLVRPTNGAGA